MSERVRRWSQIEEMLPSGFKPDDIKFLRVYFRAQRYWAQGRRDEAVRTLERLERKWGYDEFEKRHGGDLSAVEVAVLGSTRRREAPSFRIINGNGSQGENQ